MRSIGARLILLYALSATLTLAILFSAGYWLLESRLVRGLDDLDYAGFQQIKARLGDDYRGLNAQILDQRIHETSQYSSALFYISVEQPRTAVTFHSSNLGGREIPDVKGKHRYDAVVPGIGEVRVNEYVMPPFDVTIATPLRALRESMRAYVSVCAALLAAMILTSTAVGFGLSRLMLRPIRLIRETAARIGSDNFSERIPVADVRDEVSDLALLLNATFDRLENAFDQVRRFADEASHELKTPLSLIQLHAEKMLTNGELSGADTEAVVAQMESLQRLNRIIDDLLFLSRAEANAIALKLEQRSPDSLLDGFAQDATALAEHHGRRVALTRSGEARVDFDEKWIRQVLLNLLANAIAVSPPGGLIAVDFEAADTVWRVAVVDEGPGLTADQRKRMFERFTRFGVRPDGDRGSGLGLAISRSIVQLHGGRIWAEERCGRTGLRVVFEIPLRAGSGQFVRPGSFA